MMTKTFLITFPKHFLILNRQTNPHTQVEHYRFAVSVLVMVFLALLYGVTLQVYVRDLSLLKKQFFVEQSVGALQTCLILKEEEWWNFFP